MKLWGLLVVALFVSAGCGRETQESRGRQLQGTDPKDITLYEDASVNTQKYAIAFTVDTNSPSGCYIPKDLDESFKELSAMLHASFVAEFKSGPELGVVAKSHFSLGRWLRNNWYLWGEESRLGQWFIHQGITHPDDMSGIILTSYWRHLNGKRLRLKSQIRYYQDYWQEQKAKKERSNQ